MAALLTEGLVKPGPDESLPVLAEVGVGNDAVTLADHGESRSGRRRWDTDRRRKPKERTHRRKLKSVQERERNERKKHRHGHRPSTVTIGAWK